MIIYSLCVILIQKIFTEYFSIMISFLKTIPKEVYVFLVSILPVIELRGAIIVGAAPPNILNPILCYILCVIGNLLPIPFILLFIKKILEYMSKSRIKLFNKVSNKLIARAEKRSNKMNNGTFWGLFIFVAIPLPGTGAWTGALIASLLGMRFKKSMLAITLGVLVAGIIMTLGSYGLVKAFELFA